MSQTVFTIKPSTKFARSRTRGRFTVARVLFGDLFQLFQPSLMAEMNDFGIGSSRIACSRAGGDLFENHPALLSTEWVEEPGMVGNAKRSMNGENSTTGPGNPAFGNIFSHFAFQRLRRYLKHCDVVLWQIQTTPGKPGVLFQYP